MNELDNLMGAETSPVVLKDLMATPLETMTLPEGARRNRAAQIALLSPDPSKSVDNYSTMMAEDTGDSAPFTKGLQDQITSSMEQTDMKGLMDVVGDPNVSMGRKQQLVKEHATNYIRKDFSTKILTNSLSKESRDEPPDAEQARLTTADAIGEIYKQREEEQALVNSFAASLDNSTGRALYEVTSAYVAPFSQNILMATIAQNAPGGSFWKGLKAFVAPGHAKMNMRKQLEDMPLSQREQATKDLLNTISNHSTTLFANDNDFAKYQLLQEVVGQGDYSNTDKWLDTLSGALDLFALGSLVRGGKEVAKGVGAGKEIKAAGDASKGLPAPYTLAETSGKPTKGVFDDKISSLESEKANLLGDAGNTLEKGKVDSLQKERQTLANSVPDRNKLASDIQKERGVTSKEAKRIADEIIAEKKANVKASIARIDDQLNSNALASTAVQRVAELEKQINTLMKNNTEILLKKNKLSDAMSRIEMNGVARIAHPSSPMEVIKLANPEQSRNILQVIAKSEGDEVAMGLANVGRTQAMANAILPQIYVGGRLAAQVVDVQRSLRQELQIPDSIWNAMHDGGGIHFTPAERAEALSNIKHDFESANGLTLRENMGSFDMDGGNIKIGATYSPPQGDWVNAVDAMDQTKFALRQHGVTDQDITLLKKQGSEYIPVKLSDVKDTPGAYAVHLTKTMSVDPTNIVYLEKGDVKFNLFDRMPFTQWGDHGSMQALVMDASSMLHPMYTQGAVTATDRSAKFEKMLLDIANDFAEGYNKLPKAERTSMSQYIREANFNELKLDPLYVKNQYGISDAGVETLKDWRRFWDTHYYLENYDVIRTLQSQNYGIFKNKNAEFIGKELKVKDSTLGRVYDPDLDKIVELSKAEVDALYAAKGHFVTLRRPSPFHGEIVTHAISRNTPQGYLRKLTDSDQVLNYREGYYQLQYKAARFVDEISVGANGEQIRKAVAVAKSTPEARAFAKRMNDAAPPGVTYIDRADNNAIRRGSDDWFDVNAAAGRVAQRHRGKLLETGAGINHIGDGSYILDPVTSAVRSAKSIGGRTIMRPVIETMRERFLNQYGHLLDPVKGLTHFPTSSSKIGEKGAQLTKEVADARTTFNYIRYMENGYINGMDNIYKQIMHTAAELLGNVGAGRLQRGALALAEASPMSTGKGFVFTAYLATNPLRQLIIQPHQAVRMWAYNTEGWVTGRVPLLTSAYLSHSMGGPLPKGISGAKYREFAKFVDETGIMQAVDKNNLVRDALMDATNATNKYTKAASKPIDIMRRIGFDTGEKFNNLAHLASVYDKYISRGLDVTDVTVKGEAHSVARALSYDMNFAGDMSYNQTSANLILQFLQVPHKALLNYTNRRIPWQDRAKLFIGDMFFWGPPTLLVSDWIGGDILPDDPIERDFVVYGFESAFLNYAFQQLTKDDEFLVDFSSLAPGGLEGFAKIGHAFMTGGPLAALSNSPAGQLLGSQGRTMDAIRTLGRFFNGFDDARETPDKFVDTLSAFANISSGFSNATQAYMMLEAEKRIGKYGQAISDNVHFTEAMLKIAGFSTASQRDRWRLVMDVSKDTKKMTEDIQKDVKEVAKYYQTQMNQGVSSPEQMQAVSGMLLKRYSDNPKAQEIVWKEVSKLLADPEFGLFRQLMLHSGFTTPENMSDRIRMMTDMDPKQKEFLLEKYKTIGKE